MNGFVRTSVLSVAFGLLVAGVAQAQSIAEARFAALDSNKDGVVDKYEFDSSAAFATLDADHNNRISASEVEAIVGPQGDGMPSAADRIRDADENDDGELTEEELRRGAEYRFQWLDRNHDEQVDLGEMKSGFGIPSPRP